MEHSQQGIEGLKDRGRGRKRDETRLWAWAAEPGAWKRWRVSEAERGRPRRMAMENQRPLPMNRQQALRREG